MNITGGMSANGSVWSVAKPKKTFKGNKSKSQCPKRKSRLNKQHQELLTLDSEDVCLSKYIQRIYKRQKWSFMKLDKAKNKSVYYPKSQPRKPKISYMPPDHQEIINKKSLNAKKVKLTLYNLV